jgi:hypothetical protein
MAKIILIFVCLALTAEEITWVLLGLDPKSAPLNEEVLAEFAKIGLEITFNFPTFDELAAHAPLAWEKGLVFRADFDERGEIFQKWLEFATVLPNKIILIGDGNHNLTTLEDQIQILGIPTSHITLE